MKYYIGVDIGGTKIEGILINQKAKILTHQKIPTPKNKKQFLNHLFSLINKLKTKKISGIGIGAPGQINDGILIRAPNLLFAKKLNLQKIIQNKFKIKTLVENDANCFALAEAKIRKKKNLVGVILGTGLGAGIVIDGKIYSGSNNLSGEFGQIPYQDKTYEDYCSGKFFVKRGFNKKTYKKHGFHLGNLMNIIANSLNPEIIVLGGSVSNSFGLFKKSMKNNFEKSIVYPELKKTKIVISKVRHVGAIGAAFLHNL